MSGGNSEPLEYVEETEACGCVTTAAPGQTTTRLCAEHGGAVRSHTTPGQQTLGEFGLAEDLLTGDAPAGLDGGER